MISKDRAWEIGKAYLHQKSAQPYGQGVEDLRDVRFCGYDAPQDGWIMKYPSPSSGQGLCSSFIILISKETGEITYDGDAKDEG